MPIRPLILLVATVPPAFATEPVDFERDVRPILAAKCVKCHGIDQQEAGLRLDHRVPFSRGSDSGKVVVPGEPGKSLLIERVTSKDVGEVMPPLLAGGVTPLDAKQVDVLKRWITEGAKWPDDGTPFRVKSDHWAFQPITRPDPPPVTHPEWSRHDLDDFVLARLEAEGVEPSPEADRYTLIRRLYYDLIGLPPTPEEVDAFVNAKDPRAYEEIVDRLLASEHFGERWGRHWLDKARYADSDGYEKDRPRPNAWRYRDWVIDAVNRDLPFDEFTVQQLAGDLLPDATLDHRLATAFHRQTLTNTEGGTDQEQFRVEAVFDRVETTGTVWLGLTVGCARCHSHKYDPLSQTGYYQLFAFFDNGDEVNTLVPTSEAALAKYRTEKRAFDARRAKLVAEIDRTKQSLTDGQPAWEVATRQAIAREAENVIRRHDLELTGITSKAGQKLVPQKDGSYLATGDVPDTDTTTLSFLAKVPGIIGFRLDALTDDSLGGKGPGRTGHGNFVLSRVRVFVQPITVPVEPEREVTIAAAKADFHQEKFPAEGVISDADRSGWAISREMGKPHWIEFTLKEPLPESPTSVRVVLEQNYGSQHVLGRFRLQAITGSEPPLPIPEDVRTALAIDADERTAKQAKSVREHFLETRPEVEALRGQLAKLDAEAPKEPYMQVRVIGRRTNNPRTTRVLRRGDFLQPLDPVEPAAFAVLPPIDARGDGSPDRLDLARWLMSEENPLTARVAVNHVWGHLFGRGLVGTVNDFGTRGEEPTHPELLDWLATEYRRLGWSRKALIRSIVLSATYRQSSRHRPELAETDPNNELLHRQNRFRVEAEIVRDLHLAASGLLSTKVGGPSVFPPLPADVAALSYANNFKWKTSPGEDRYRRGMYTFFKRTSPHPNLTSFDCPDANTTNVDRGESNTPLQALILLNNDVFVETSRHFAKRILASQATDDERLTHAFRLCVARPPTTDELAEFRSLLAAARSFYAEHPEDSKAMTAAHAADGVASDENAAWVATCRIIANMDEFITRE